MEEVYNIGHSVHGCFCIDPEIGDASTVEYDECEHSCPYENDGVCDAWTAGGVFAAWHGRCPAGTDQADCHPSAPCNSEENGVCEAGLTCPEGTDAVDCNSTNTTVLSHSRRRLSGGGGDEIEGEAEEEFSVTGCLRKPIASERPRFWVFVSLSEPTVNSFFVRSRKWFMLTVCLLFAIAPESSTIRSRLESERLVSFQVLHRWPR